MAAPLFARAVSDGGRKYAVVMVEFVHPGGAGPPMEAAARQALLQSFVNWSRTNASLICPEAGPGFTACLPADADARDGFFVELKSPPCATPSEFLAMLDKAEDLQLAIASNPRYVSEGGAKYRVTATLPLAPENGDKVYWFKKIGDDRVMQSGIVVDDRLAATDGSINVKYTPVDDGNATLGDERVYTVNIMRVCMRPFSTRVIDGTRGGGGDGGGEACGGGGGGSGSGAGGAVPLLLPASPECTDSDGGRHKYLTVRVPWSSPEFAACDAFTAWPRQYLIETCEQYERALSLASSAEDAAKWGALLGLWRYRRDN